MGYPDADAEMTMLADHGGGSPLEGMRPVVSVEDAARLVAHVREVHVSDAVRAYVVALGRATRSHPQIRLGASPRALLQLQAAARAEAALSGREYVLPDDVRAVAVPVLAHRLMLDRRAGTDSAEELVRAVLDEVRVPAEQAPGTR
jgi:MoxR-like ATPase